MNLRNGTTVGAGILQSSYKPQFEEGVKLLLSKWTALQLAVENRWGGRDSVEKANDAIDEILEWFYRRRGA
jgi:pre-rRNA-processing protein TSR2